MKKILAVSSITLAALMMSPAQAGVIPFGIQTNVTNATVSSWGWTECARSSSTGNAAVAPILSACNLGYMAMGVWDASLGAYGVIGIGVRDMVTAITYADSNGDNSGTVQNWSNGLNWYRTASSGSWGFTTSSQTALNTADINLVNGLQNEDSIGTNEIELAAGLSLHLDAAGNFHNGWAYNPDGNNFTHIYDAGDQRVFWTTNAVANPVPTSSTVAILGLGLALLGISRRRKPL